MFIVFNAVGAVVCCYTPLIYSNEVPEFVISYLLTGADTLH